MQSQWCFAATALLSLFAVVSSHYQTHDINKKYYQIPAFSVNLVMPKWSKAIHPHQCPSEIYCFGELLHTVQVAAIFNDSKYFVDMKMNQGEQQTLEAFNSFMTQHNGAPSKADLKDWIEEHFSPGASALIKWSPPDWKPQPAFLQYIHDNAFREWASSLNNFWSNLGRRFKQDVYDHPELYSFIPVPNPVIVPGGRFLEFYYWDSYWVLRGLLYCEMFQTSRGIIDNFRSMIRSYRHIPNGGRVYYLGRSHPPLLTLMVQSYLEFTNDRSFAVSALDELEIEFEFFEELHTVEVGRHTLYRYIDDSSGPRPESYKEDYFTAEYFDDEDAKEEFYSEIKAAAESGMDFTSRWFITDKGTNEGQLHDIRTRSIVPVELNAIIYRNALTIAYFCELAGDSLKAEIYKEKADMLLAAIDAVLWNDQQGAWLDYDLINKRHRPYFSASNLSPLWLKAFRPENEAKITEKVFGYIKSTGIDDFPGGVPNTLQNASSEQWDYPNAWAPMQYMLIMGLDSLNNQTAKRLAYLWAEKWIRNNYLAFRDTGAMFEKYSATVVGDHGGGGEYETQIGFGWSNGVVIELLYKYGHLLRAVDFSDTDEPDQNKSGSTHVNGPSVCCMLSLLTVLTLAVMMKGSQVLSITNFTNS